MEVMMKYIFSEETTFLVTGCAGFIGSNLSEYILSIGYKVIGLDNFSTGKKENMNNFIDNQNFKFIKGDIRDKNTCETAVTGVDYVLHQAALGSIPRSINNPYESNDSNVNGFLNLIIASKNCGVKRFVFASSSSVYGDHPKLPKVEGVEGKILSPYALTKKIDEEYGRLFYEIYGLPTIGLRYFNVFGKRQDPNSVYAAVIPKFIKALLDKRRPTIFGDGFFSRDFTYIQNVIDANLLSCLSTNDSFGEVFNIACGDRVSIIDLYNSIAKELKSEIEPLYSGVRKGDVPHSNANISKAKKMLEYNPRYSFEEGLKITIKWYKVFLGE
ncbi:MAG: SDR family oxidoreductase [Tenericutes bacterium]|nr:SDR family oxidoreductase [Mycoplasmatota bacterium]